MNAFKNLKSLFIVEEKGKEEKEKEAKAVPKKTVVPKSKPVKSSPSPVSAGGNLDERIIDTLLKVIEANNLEGFDYLEFKKSLQSMEKMAMNEATRFQSAFATASTMGVTLDNLVNTANHYIKILDKEKQKFAETVSRNESQMVKQKKLDIDAMSEHIKKKEKHIAQLQKEIEEDKIRAEKMTAEISESQHKIELTKSNFEKSFLSLRDQFAGDIEKMKKYLK